MKLYKPSGKFSIVSLLSVLIISSSTAFIIALGFHYFSKLIGFSIIGLFPFIELFILFFVIKSLFPKFPIRSPKIGYFFGLIFGLILFLTPHIITYYELRAALVNYYLDEYNLSASELNDFAINLIDETIDFSLIDYIELRAGAGTSIAYRGRTSDFGSFGFYATEVVDFIILVLLTTFIVGSLCAKPFSEKKDEWYQTFTKFPLKNSCLRDTGVNLKIKPDIDLIINLVKKGPFISRKNDRAVYLELLSTSDKEEFSISVNNDYYLLTKEEAVKLKRLLVREIMR